MTLYLAAKKFWPIIFFASMDDMWGTANKKIKYSIYNDITDIVSNLTTTQDADSTLRVAIQPTYSSFPIITKVVICSQSQTSTGTGDDVNNCVTDATCTTTTKFCMEPGNLFWCQNSLNLYLGN